VASKHAVVAFCDAVRKEIVGTDVRMSVVEPGLVDTPMARNHPAIDEVLGKVVPLDADDVARAVEFILDQPAHCSINELLLRPTNQDL
jgi:NADP-dependent 3-hydroxy acid dehydrogenase YdfG